MNNFFNYFSPSAFIISIVIIYIILVFSAYAFGVFGIRNIINKIFKQKQNRRLYKCLKRNKEEERFK